ncbi:MAG: T9SS type A sorting domain-containing protein [Hymenobacter sp.]|nr:MAG: T9SS type A sorting domain-containing protein [Hymenobacter sp.]
MALLALLLVRATAYAQSTPAPRPLVQLNLQQNTGATDATYIYFEAGATTDFDGNFDASKFANSTGLNLASYTQPIAPNTVVQRLSINGLPPSLLDVPSKVNLFVGVPVYGTYSLLVARLEFFTTAQVYLADSTENTTVLLAPGTTYSFETTAANTNNTSTTRRFSLLFEPAASLPVTLTGFTAQAQAQPPGVALAWHTATERNSAYFAVERSADGQLFTEIGRVAAAGTSGQAHSYAYFDPQALSGTSYYRLRQVDLDGTFQYSPVRVVSGQSALAGLRFFPNPAQAGAALRGATPGAWLQILNMLGQVVATAPADASGTVLLPASLPGGVYVVRSGQQATPLVVE